MIRRPLVPAAAEDLYDRVGSGVRYRDDERGFLYLLLCRALGTALEDLHDLADSDWTVAIDPDTTPDVAYAGQFLGIRYDQKVDGEANRQRLRDRRQWHRGGIDAIRQAAQETLLPGASIIVIERDGGPYKVTIRTYTAQTPNPAATLAAIQSVFPVGHTLDYAAVTGNTIYAVTRAFATINDQAAYFATIDQVRDGSLP